MTAREHAEKASKAMSHTSVGPSGKTYFDPDYESAKAHALTALALVAVGDPEEDDKPPNHDRYNRRGERSR